MKKTIMFLNLILGIANLVLGLISFFLLILHIDFGTIDITHTPYSINFSYIANPLLFISGLVFIIRFVFLAIANNKLDNAVSKNELAVISVLTLLFGDVLSGIFMIFIREDDLKVNKDEDK